MLSIYVNEINIIEKSENDVKLLLSARKYKIYIIILYICRYSGVFALLYAVVVV